MAPRSTAATSVKRRVKKANSVPADSDADEEQSAITPPDAGKTKAATNVHGLDLHSLRRVIFPDLLDLLLIPCPVLRSQSTHGLLFLEC